MRKSPQEARKPVTELTEMDVEFVSLVPKGANRQTKFLVMKMINCPACKAENEEGVTVCSACGSGIEGEKPKEKPEEKAEQEKAVPNSEASSDGKEKAAEEVASQDTTNALPQDQKGEPGSGAEKSGTNDTESGGAELSSRLNSALEKLAKIKMPAPLPAVVEAAEVHKADEVQVEKGDAEAAKEEIAKATTEAAEMRVQVQKLTEELAKERTAKTSALAEAARLRSGIGTPASIRTGETVAKAARSTGEDKVRWSRDLAADVAAERRAKLETKGKVR